MMVPRGECAAHSWTFSGVRKSSFDQEGWRLAIALGAACSWESRGERHKGSGPGRAPSGVRTFALG